MVNALEQEVQGSTSLSDSWWHHNNIEETEIDFDWAHLIKIMGHGVGKGECGMRRKNVGDGGG